MSSPEQAFRALHDAHFRLVWSSLRRLGARDADVLDLAQKVFLTAYLKLPEFEGRSSVGTWLFGICQRVASDYRKSARIKREVSLDTAELDELPGAMVDATQGFDTRQRTEYAEAILEKLPEAQRHAFVLYELEELSARDIAALLGTSVGTVRSRLRLGRRAFARELQRHGEPAGDPPRLLNPRTRTSRLVRHMLGLVRDVRPPAGAATAAWHALSAHFQPAHS